MATRKPFLLSADTKNREIMPPANPNISGNPTYSAASS